MAGGPLGRLLGGGRRDTDPTPAAASLPPGPLLPPPVVTLLGLAAALVVLGGLRTAQSVVAPVLLALVIAIAVHPVQAWLRARVPGWLALVVTLVVTYAFLTAFAGALTLSVLRFADQAGRYQAELNQLVQDAENLLREVGVDQEQIDAFVGGFDLNRIFDLALDVALTGFSVVSNLFFVLLLLFFLLIDAGGADDRMRAVAALRPRAAEALHSFTYGTRQYLVVTAVFGAVVAALDVVLLVVLGVPLPLLWGLLVFLASFVPTVGLIVGIVPPAVIALLDGGPVEALWVVVGFLVVNNVIDNFVKPKFVGDAVGISITLAFLSLVVWGFVLGPLGALLAIPATLLTRAVLLSPADPRHRWVTWLLADRAPTDEEVAATVAEARAAAGSGEDRPGSLPPAPGAAGVRGRARRSARSRRA
ncbi:AI-2E family transporter [Aquipuribacter sp. SD81]|uniref:AI-2E family transporter n=1 Tax=Aquipuribacter sp. SD81 TaxID=3127703 RepID=UPI003017B1FB